MSVIFKDGALLFDGGQLAMSEACCCGTLCDVGVNPTAYKAVVTANFFPCSSPPPVHDDCDTLDPSGEYFSAGGYVWFKASGPGEWGCGFGEHFNDTFRLQVNCAQNFIALLADFDSGVSVPVRIAFLESITPQAGVTYILTPSTGTLALPGGPFTRPCLIESATVIITAL